MEINKKKRKGKNITDENGWNIKSPKNFEELLQWPKISEDNSYSSLLFWKACYEITCDVIKNGHEFENLSDPLPLMYIFMDKIEDYRITRRSVISMYPLTDTFDRFSMDTICFLCQCNMIIIISEIDPTNFSERYLPQTEDYKILLAQELLMFYPTKKLVEEYNYSEIDISLYRIAQCWPNITVSKSLEKFLNGIVFRISQVIKSYDETFMDVSDNNSKNASGIKIPDKEFLSHVSNTLGYMKTPFIVLKRVVKFGSLEVEGQKTCEKRDISEVYNALCFVMKENVKFWNTETARKMIKTLTYVLYVRPGEESKYARANGGTYIKDPSEVLDTYRTEFQNFIVYKRIATIESNIPPKIDVSKPFFSRDERNSMITTTKSATLFKLFDNICMTDCNFKWIENCLLLERDFSSCYSVIENLKHPIIIQMGGEFNVLFEGYLYKTMSAELSITFWIMIVFYRLGCKMWIKQEIYDISPIKKKIERECTRNNKHDNVYEPSDPQEINVT
jgi:hypothetical protein